MLNSRCKRIVQMITGLSSYLESSPNRRPASVPPPFSLAEPTGNGQRETGNVSGFSLIEVLVATALLIMIVGMIGFVFRQSSMSWDSGIRRAEGTTRVRAVIGAIERDLRAAVDAREFGMTQTFSANSMTFVALLEPEGGSPDQRVPTQITYTGGTSVERTAKRLTSSGSSWSATGNDRSTLLESDGNAKVSVRYDCSSPPADTPGGLPAYVTIQAELVTEDAFSGLKVISYGRDGKKGTRDDIVVE